MSHMKPDMKSLLYEWDNGKSYTPPATGKKRLIETSTEAPFATMDHEPGKIFDKAYIKRPSKSYAFDKVGASRLFDPAVYLSNYERGLSDRKDSSLRNFTGSGDILAHYDVPQCHRNAKMEIENDEAPDV